MSQNTRDGVEGVLAYGLSHLNHDHNTPVTKWVNQSETNTPSSPPIKKFIHNTLQSPPGPTSRSPYIYDYTRLGGGGGLGWEHGDNISLLFFLFFLILIWITCKRTAIFSSLFYTILFIYNSLQLLLFVILLSCYGIIEIFCVITGTKEKVNNWSVRLLRSTVQ